MKYQVFTRRNLLKIPPFKTHNYVVIELIDQDNYLADPLYILNFPQREMLGPSQLLTVIQYKKLLKVDKRHAPILLTGNKQYA